MRLLVKSCNYERMNVQRLFARGVVLAGVVITGAAIFGAFARMGYTAQTPMAYAQTAAVPFAMAVIIFLVGLWFEVLAAALLGVGAVAIVAWGLIMGWEPNVWLVMASIVIGPMLFSGALYLLASQTQMVCSLEEKSK
jgi:hypothetical protein